MRVVDTYEYVSMLKGLTEAGNEVSMLIAGNSMSPFLIHQRDTILFRKPDRPLKKGDMVFFQRRSGQYVMHRICRVKKDGYYIVGDAQTEIEGPVAEEQIFAIITKVKRKGKWIGPEDLLWKLFEGPWVWVIPWRHTIINVYSVFYRMIHKNKKDSRT